MRILLAIDDSECSAAATRAVLEQFVPSRTHVTVLHADEWPKGMPSCMSFAEGASAANSILGLHALRREDASILIRSAVDRLRRVGFTATASLRSGDARQTIVDCAKEDGADLIVIGSHGKIGFDRMLGSVSDSVARHASCSVEIVRAAAAEDRSSCSAR